MTPVMTYIVGFLASTAVTLAAFGAVMGHLDGTIAAPPHVVAAGLILFAVIQLLVQALCFLHLSEEEGPRWRLASFLLALLFTAILIGGTLWIMRTIGHGTPEYREIFEGGEYTPQAQHD